MTHISRLHPPSSFLRRIQLSWHMTRTSCTFNLIGLYQNTDEGFWAQDLLLWCCRIRETKCSAIKHQRSQLYKEQLHMFLWYHCCELLRVIGIKCILFSMHKCTIFIRLLCVATQMLELNDIQLLLRATSLETSWRYPWHSCYHSDIQHS